MIRFKFVSHPAIEIYASKKNRKMSGFACFAAVSVHIRWNENILNPQFVKLFRDKVLRLALYLDRG
jgi:hypothetical protein